MRLSSARKHPIQQTLIFAALSLAALVAGCAYNPAFPIQEGDIFWGKKAFIDHQCHQCHSVSGVNLPTYAGAGPVQLELGGEVVAVSSYGDLMTSIINPNHIISEKYREKLSLNAALPPQDSPMPMPNIDNMTVRQLIDLVAFLHSRYILIEEYDSDSGA